MMITDEQVKKMETELTTLKKLTNRMLSRVNALELENSRLKSKIQVHTNEIARLVRKQ